MSELRDLAETKLSTKYVTYKLNENNVEVTMLNTKAEGLNYLPGKTVKYISYVEFLDILKGQNVNTYVTKLNARLKTIAKLINVFYGDVRTTELQLPPNVVSLYKESGTNSVTFRVVLKGSLTFGLFEVEGRKYETYVDAGTYVVDIELSDEGKELGTNIVEVKKVTVSEFKGLKYSSKTTDSDLKYNEYLTKKLESKIKGVEYIHGQYQGLDIEKALCVFTEDELKRNEKLADEVKKVETDAKYNRIDWSGIKWD